MVSVVCLISYNRGGASARWHDHSRFTQCGGKKNRLRASCTAQAELRRRSACAARLARSLRFFFVTVCEVLMTLLCGERESVCVSVLSGNAGGGNAHKSWFRICRLLPFMLTLSHSICDTESNLKRFASIKKHVLLSRIPPSIKHWKWRSICECHCSKWATGDST